MRVSQTPKLPVVSHCARARTRGLVKPMLVWHASVRDQVRVQCAFVHKKVLSLFDVQSSIQSFQTATTQGNLQITTDLTVCIKTYYR